MTLLEATPDLLRVAQRCVWFKSPEKALTDTRHFVAHVLTYGMAQDVRVLRAQLCDDDLRDALEHAPPGIIDGRSWAYWRLMLDLPPKPLPQRRFD